MENLHQTQVEKVKSSENNGGKNKKKQKTGVYLRIHAVPFGRQIIRLYSTSQTLNGLYFSIINFENTF